MHAKQRWRDFPNADADATLTGLGAGACTFIVDLPSLDACKLRLPQSRQAPDARGRTRRSIVPLVSRERVFASA